VIEEATVETPSGTLIPDLAVVQQRRFQAVQVTVHHKDMGYLEEGHNSKIARYSPLQPLLANQFNAKPGRVLPIVIGTRGTLPKSTLSSLADLNITDKGSYITLKLLASTEIFHASVDYDAPPRHPATPVAPP
jgi:hypothetical protein